MTTGTTLTSNYANGVLTVSGVADVATYQTVLQSVQCSDTSSPASAGDRTISIVVNDGTDAARPPPDRHRRARHATTRGDGRQSHGGAWRRHVGDDHGHGLHRRDGGGLRHDCGDNVIGQLGHADHGHQPGRLGRHGGRDGDRGPAAPRPPRRPTSSPTWRRRR